MLLGYIGYRGFSGSSRVSGNFLGTGGGYLPITTGISLFFLAWLFPHFSRYFTSSWNFPGIAAVVLYWSVHMLVRAPIGR